VFLALRFFLLLQDPHLEVGAGALEQLAVRAALDDAAVVHDQDLVGVHDGGETVRDDQRGVAAGDAVQLGLDRFLRFRVERRGRLVEDQDARVLQDRARDRDALLLAAGELEAALAPMDS
jgi:hypothetical protein